MNSRNISVTLLICAFLFGSCKKEIKQVIGFSEARYTLEITGKWSSPDFTVPSGVHFTNFAGMVHNNNTFLWQENKIASIGIENVAETGSTSALLLEIDSIIQGKQAVSLLYFTPPLTTSSKNVSFYCNSDFSSVSFISMIAPSPDWFIGISNLNLYENNNWVNDTIIPLYVQDAGTEEGDVFGYNNPSTFPQQNVMRLTANKATVLANGNAELKPIATLNLRKF